MSELTQGDRVRFVHMPSKLSREAYGEEPAETEATVAEIVEETKHLPGSTIEQTLAVLDCDNGDEREVNVEHLDSEIDSTDGGVTMQRLEEAA